MSKKHHTPYFDRHLVGFVCLGKVYSDEPDGLDPDDPESDGFHEIGYLLRKGPEIRIVLSKGTPIKVEHNSLCFNNTQTAFKELFGGNYLEKDICGKWIMRVKRRGKKK